MSLKWVVVVLGLGFAAILVGTSAFGRMPAPVQRETPPALGVVPPSPTVAPQPTSPILAQPAPTQAPTGPSWLTAATAAQTVRAYFAALAAKDFATARQLTAGQARETTDQLIDRLQAEERARGVTIVVQTQRLDLASPIAAGGQWQVSADFSVDIGAQVGPVVIPAQTIAGQATFTVDQVAGQARIVRIAGLQL